MQIVRATVCPAVFTACNKKDFSSFGDDLLSSEASLKGPVCHPLGVLMALSLGTIVLFHTPALPVVSRGGQI